MCSCSSSAVSHSHPWAASQFVSITLDLAAKGGGRAIEYVCLPGGGSGKVFNGEGIWIGEPEFLDLLWFQPPWLSLSSWESQVLWNCVLLLKIIFMKFSCANRMPMEKKFNLNIWLLTLLPRIMAFVRTFRVLHINFLSLAYLVLITTMWYPQFVEDETENSERSSNLPKTALLEKFPSSKKSYPRQSFQF